MENYLTNELFVGIVSRKEFLLLHEDGLLPHDIAVICILDPDIEFHDKMIMKSYNSALQIRFWDVEVGVGKYQPLTKEQGQKIKEFILENKDKRFLVHCMAGQSRSAGVACAIECIANFDGNNYEYATGKSDVKNHDRYSPNYTVYDAIIKEGD